MVPVSNGVLLWEALDTGAIGPVSPTNSSSPIRVSEVSRLPILDRPRGGVHAFSPTRGGVAT